MIPSTPVYIWRIAAICTWATWAYQHQTKTTISIFRFLLKLIGKMYLVARFRLKTGHDCLAAHLHKIKVYSSDECTLCRIQGISMNADHLLNWRKLDSSAQTAGDIAKLYWDARFLMG
jgi:hypothetical protein